jgi:hypothetical protein
MTDEHPPFTLKYEEHECMLTPAAVQEYSNCFFEAGFVQGHPNDTVYIRLGREGVEPFIALLRFDEMLALSWVMSGTMWSSVLGEIAAKEGESDG